MVNEPHNPNLQDMRKFYLFLNHKFPTEIRVFGKIHPEGKSVFINGETEFIQAALDLNLQEDVYIGARDRTNTTGDSIKSSFFIFVEIDEHDAEKPTEILKFENFLRQNKIRYSMKIFSGGGYHYYIAHLNGIFETATERELYKQFLVRFRDVLLKYKIDIDKKVFDLPRVTRIAGSWNHKRGKLSKIIEYNVLTEAEITENAKNIKSLVDANSNEEKKINASAIEILKKYEFDVREPWLYEILNNKIVIKADTGGNSTVFKNAAILLMQANLSNEEIRIVGKELAKLCEGRSEIAFQGWVRKVRAGEIVEFHNDEIDKWIAEKQYPLTKYCNKRPEILIATNPQEYSAINMKQFFSIQDGAEKPIIAGFIPEKSMAIIFGEPASCKSIFTNYIGCCVSTNIKFLGKYKVKNLPVLILSTENPERTDRKRLKAIFKGMKVMPKRRNFENLKLLYSGRQNLSVLNDEPFYAKLVKLIETNKIGLLIIDTISPLIMDQNDNVGAEIVNVFNNRLFPLIDKFGLSIIMTMHSQKSGKDFLGSVKIKASSDCFYELMRGENSSEITMLCHKNREGEHNLKFKIHFNNKNEILDKVDFEFVEEFAGKQSISNKDFNPARIQQATDVIITTLSQQECKYSQLIEECKKQGITVATSKRAINCLYEAGQIKKKRGKSGGYHLP